MFEDGDVVERGTFVLPHVAPRAKGALNLPKPATSIDPSKEYAFRVSFRQKTATKWAERGFEVAWNQLPYGRRPELKDRVGEGTLDLAVRASASEIVVTAEGLSACFSRKSGTISSLMLGGKAILSDRAGIVCGPRLQVERAFTDSDTWMRVPFMQAGLSQLSFHPRAIRVEERSGEIMVICHVRVTSSKSGGFEHVATWIFRRDGTIRVDNEMVPFGDIPPLPRVGTFMRLDGALEKLEYFGRGPWENMVDRSTGCDVAHWTSTVSEQFVAHIRPQDCGGKTDVRWAQLTDPKDGKGVRFTAVGEPFMFQALRFTREDIDQSRHRPAAQTVTGTLEPRRFQRLVPREEVCLSLDCRQMGVGCNNCGPIPLDKYRFPVERTVWTYVISPPK